MPTREEWEFAFAHEAGCTSCPLIVNTIMAPNFVPEEEIDDV